MTPGQSFPDGNQFKEQLRQRHSQTGSSSRRLVILPAQRMQGSSNLADITIFKTERTNAGDQKCFTHILISFACKGTLSCDSYVFSLPRLPVETRFRRTSFFIA